MTTTDIMGMDQVLEMKEKCLLLDLDSSFCCLIDDRSHLKCEVDVQQESLVHVNAAKVEMECLIRIFCVPLLKWVGGEELELPSSLMGYNRSVDFHNEGGVEMNA